MKNVSRLVLATSLTVAAVTLYALNANAQGIGINFTGSTSGATVSMTPADQPGIVAGANWNNVTGATGSGISLIDNSAVATSAVLSFNSGSASSTFGTPATANAARNRMYTGGITESQTVPIPVTVRVTGIPYATYDVYVYSSPDSTATNTLTVSDGITSFYYRSNGSTNAGAAALTLTTSTLSGSPTVGAAQYQFFGGETSPVLTLTAMDFTPGNASNNVFGVQIVKSGSASSAPEPGSIALTILSGLPVIGGVIARRKRAA